MSVKRVLFIDDNKIDSIIEKLRKNLKRNGFTLQEDILDLNDDHFKKKDENNPEKIVLDFVKIKEFLKDKFFNENIDVVVSDYDYSDPDIDGYKLIKWLKNVTTSEKKRIRRAQYYLYSAKGDSIVEKIDSLEKVKSLVKIKLEDIFDRNNLPDELSSAIRKRDEAFLFLETILNQLEKYSEFEFNSVFPKFKGKKLEEIAEEIDKDLPNGIEFQKALAELTIAHLIKLNNIEEKND